MDTGKRLAVDLATAVAMTGIGRSSIYAAIARRELAILKVGRRTLVEVDELKRWLAAHRVPVAADKPTAAP